MKLALFEVVAMSAIRWSMACVGLLLLIGCQDGSVKPMASKLEKLNRPARPTDEQLKAAKEAFAKFGAQYQDANPFTKEKVHFFDMPKGTTDATLSRLPNPPFSFGLGLSATKVTDAGLKELKGLKALTMLALPQRITDAGLKELKDLKALTWLDISYTHVTDTGLKELKDLKALTWLILTSTQVTDAGLKELKDLKALTTLALNHTQVTDAGVNELKGHLPGCKIIH